MKKTLFAIGVLGLVLIPQWGNAMEYNAPPCDADESIILDTCENLCECENCLGEACITACEAVTDDISIGINDSHYYAVESVRSACPPPPPAIPNYEKEPIEETFSLIDACPDKPDIVLNTCDNYCQCAGCEPVHNYCIPRCVELSTSEGDPPVIPEDMTLESFLHPLRTICECTLHETPSDWIPVLTTYTDLTSPDWCAAACEHLIDKDCCAFVGPFVASDDTSEYQECLTACTGPCTGKGGVELRNCLIENHNLMANLSISDLTTFKTPTGDELSAEDAMCPQLCENGAVPDNDGKCPTIKDCADSFLGTRADDVIALSAARERAHVGVMQLSGRTRAIYCNEVCIDFLQGCCELITAADLVTKTSNCTAACTEETDTACGSKEGTDLWDCLVKTIAPKCPITVVPPPPTPVQAMTFDCEKSVRVEIPNFILDDNGNQAIDGWGEAHITIIPPGFPSDVSPESALVLKTSTPHMEVTLNQISGYSPKRVIAKPLGATTEPQTLRVLDGRWDVKTIETSELVFKYSISQDATPQVFVLEFGTTPRGWVDLSAEHTFELKTVINNQTHTCEIVVPQLLLHVEGGCSLIRD